MIVDTLGIAVIFLLAMVVGQLRYLYRRSQIHNVMLERAQREHDALALTTPLSVVAVSKRKADEQSDIPLAA